MRAAMYHQNDDVRLVELPQPSIGEGELLFKVMACGICGSDVLEWYRKAHAPRVLGHEAVGEVVEVGGGVRGFSQGDRVFVSHHVPCGKCRFCRKGHETVCDTLRSTNFDPGGFAERVRVPQINVEKGTYRLPDSLSYEGGVFIEPLGCVLRSHRLSGFQKGESVHVIGGGLSGLLHVLALRAAGAHPIFVSEPVESRREAARKAGADFVWAAGEDVPAKIRTENGGAGADLVILATGAPSAFQEGFRTVDRGGTVLLFAPTEPGAALPVPMNDFWKDEVKITTSYGAAPGDLIAALRQIEARQSEYLSLITHRLSLAETGLGFKLVARAQDSLKVIIEPQR